MSMRRLRIGGQTVLHDTTIFVDRFRETDNKDYSYKRRASISRNPFSQSYLATVLYPSAELMRER
jgi:hypothetical protein